jgi:hypothetical protein
VTNEEAVDEQERIARERDELRRREARAERQRLQEVERR